MLVIAAGDQDHFFLKGAQTRDGAGGAAGNGVVIKPRAVIGAHQLDAVLHTVKAAGEIADHLVGHQTIHRGDGRHIILHVVYAGQANVLRLHDHPLLSVLAADNSLAPQKNAVRRLLAAAEIPHLSRGTAPLLAGNVVIQIENGDVPRLLVAENILLGGHIFRHVLVHVQMIGRQIRHHGNVRALPHGHELEAAQLQHGVVLRTHFIRLTQKRVSDVAAHVDGLSGGLQQLGDDGGGGGLPVRAGDGDERAGADGEKHLHLRRQLAPLLLRPQKLRHIGPQPRRAEDHVLIETMQIVRPQLQPAAAFFQLVGQLSQCRALPLVAGGHADALPQQQTQQRRIAHTDADDGNGLAFQRIQILAQSHSL